MATPETIAEQQALVGINSDYKSRINADYKTKFGFHDSETGYAFKAPKGLTPELVAQISEFKNEPQWMLDFRLKAYEHFISRPQPTWGSPFLAEVDYDNIHYFVRASEKSSTTWDDVPEDIKNTFDKLGIPEAERKFLSGVGAQYESEVVYHQVREDLEKQGVVFMDMDSGLREHEDLVREYFATIIPSNDNKLAALNSAVWSGGSFVYVPPGVHVEMPLQAYFRINTENMGQFERTLIIADEGSYVHYVEGCTAPIWSSGLAALRGGRADRQAGRADPLHDRAELVAERLQPRHQARDRRDRRDRRVGRLQPRLEADDEVPERLPDGRARPRRGALDRVRRQRPAPGRGREDHPRGAEHDVEHLRQVDLQGRRALARTAACSRSPRAPTARGRRSSATRCCSTRTRARTPIRRSASARTTSTSATRPRSPRSARSSSST